MKIYRISQQQQIQLPPIPANCTRQTHFTKSNNIQAILSGGFKYSTTLQATTDPFTDNSAILNLINTGKTGAWSRKEFGDSVILIDLTMDEQKKLYGNSFYIKNNTIPPTRIVGYVYQGKFNPNPSYNILLPLEILQMNKPQPGGSQPTTPQQQPAPSGNAQDNDVF